MHYFTGWLYFHLLVILILTFNINVPTDWVPCIVNSIIYFTF